MNLKFLAAALLASSATVAPAAIIGTNVAPVPVTEKRIAALPPAEASAWKAYLDRSREQLKQDQDFLRDEMKRNNLTNSTSAPAARNFRGLRLDAPEVWYAETNAHRIANIVVSFQTPGGGWSKRLDMTQHERAPGEQFTADNNSRFLTDGDNDEPRASNWSYVGTFDNDATTTQMRFLARVIGASPPKDTGKFRIAFLHGMDYILASQFPNGGWPQVWPLQGGYHDAITYNDSAMTRVLQLLKDVRDGQKEYSFVPAAMRRQAGDSLKRGIDCILATQIIVDGKRTAWCQQHDAITLKPAPARNYEMPSLCSAESAGIVLFLMSMGDNDPRIVEAVQGAVQWFEKTALRDVAFRNTGDNGRLLVPAPGVGPIWSRYSDIESNRPIFGERDKTIHDAVEEISRERRAGYAWFTEEPSKALKSYGEWTARRASK